MLTIRMGSALRALVVGVCVLCSTGCATTVALKDPQQVAGVERRSDREEGTMVLRDGREYPAKFVRYRGPDVRWITDGTEHQMSASEVQGVRFEQRNVARVQGLLLGLAAGTVAGGAIMQNEYDPNRPYALEGLDAALVAMGVGMVAGAGVGSGFPAPVTYEWRARDVALPKPDEKKREYRRLVEAHDQAEFGEAKAFSINAETVEWIDAEGVRHEVAQADLSAVSFPASETSLGTRLMKGFLAGAFVGAALTATTVAQDGFVDRGAVTALGALVFGATGALGAGAAGDSGGERRTYLFPASLGRTTTAPAQHREDEDES